jgi:hypothetical protein
MVRQRAGLDEPTGTEQNGVRAAILKVPRWVSYPLRALVLVWWVVASGFPGAFVLAPAGVVIVVVLSVLRLFRRPVGGWLAVMSVATAWSLIVLGSLLGWADSAPPSTTVAGRPGDLTVEQQVSIDAAERQFFEVAYGEKNLDRYRRHVIGYPERSQLDGCWDDAIVDAQPSSRVVHERVDTEGVPIVDVKVGFIVADVVYHVGLEVTLDDWQVVELDRVPGYEHCPMGFPLPPGPLPGPSATG